VIELIKEFPRKRDSMSKKVSKDLFVGFYGYSPVCTISDDTKLFNVGDLSKDYLRYSPSFLVSESFKNELKRLRLQSRTLRQYTPPIDQFTNDGYIEWAKSFEAGEISSDSNWILSKIKSNPSWSNLDKFNSLKYILSDFWSVYRNLKDRKVKRSSTIFRFIELNEFFGRADENQTLKDFLESDDKIEEACKNFIYRDYGDSSLKLSPKYDDYRFMDFDKNLPATARKLFLEMNKKDLSKVILDRESNQLKNTHNSKTGSLVFIKDFIDRALNPIVVKKRAILSDKEIRDEFMLKVVSDTKYWKDSLGDLELRSRIMAASSLVYEAYSRQPQAVEFLSYLISNDLLEDYNPKKLFAIMLCGSNTNYWISRSSAYDARQVLMDKTDSGEININVVLELMSKIVIEELPIISGANVDWSLFNGDIHADWLYNMFNTVSNSVTIPYNFKQI